MDQAQWAQTEIALLPTEQIALRPSVQQKSLSHMPLETLAASMAREGLREPILVRAAAQGYIIVEGNRRLMACRMLGWREIPARVQPKDVSDMTSAGEIFAALRARPMGYLDRAEATTMQTGMINLVWNKHSTDKYLRLAFQALANADDLNTANYGSLYDNDPCFMEKSQPGWYTTKGEEFFCQNDPEKAKELLAQSSFDTSKPLRILTATGGGAEAMLEVLRQEAAKIGVTLEITATDRTTMTSMRNDETLYDAYFTTFSSVAVPSLRNFLSADYAGWSDDEHLQELMLQMTTAATKEAAFAAWEEIQYYCYSDYCPILMMGHFHQAAACTNRLTGYNVFLTTNFWNAKLAK